MSTDAPMEQRSLLRRLPLAALLAVLMPVLHPIAAAPQTASATLEQKALEHIKEARGHARQARYSRALSELRVAVALAEQSQRTKLTLALALHNTAEVHRLEGKPGDALKGYYEALRIYSELDHKPAIAVTQSQIDALLAASNIERPEGSAPAPSAPARGTGSRLNRIDRAVDRIRRRLESSEEPRPAATLRSGTAPGSIEISSSSARAGSEAVGAAYAESVIQRIHREWKYPDSARSKHQEGSVEIELAIFGSGELESLRILQSSGFVALDMETIRSVREAAPFSQLPREQQAGLRLLFNYKLPKTGETRIKAQSPEPDPPSR